MGKDDLDTKPRAAETEMHGEPRLQSPDGWRLLLADGTILDCRDGVVEGPPPAALPIVIERAQVVAEPGAGRIRVELNGRIGADAPPFATNVFISEALARALALSLSTAAYQMRLTREEV